MSCQIRQLFCKTCLVSVFVGFSQCGYADIHDISRIFHSSPTISSFEICHSGGCADVSQVVISDEEWLAVAEIFDEQVTSPAHERAQIADAIGMLETLIGHKIGTAGDLAGTFGNSQYKGQLDCNDEAINTTTYMRLLQSQGLMLQYDIEDTRTRNFFLTGWPHSTAVIRYIATGEQFAVDSWFYDNGHAATIVPFKVWKANYLPADSPIGKTRIVKPNMDRSVITKVENLETLIKK